MKILKIVAATVQASRELEISFTLKVTLISFLKISRMKHMIFDLNYHLFLVISLSFIELKVMLIVLEFLILLISQELF